MTTLILFALIAIIVLLTTPQDERGPAVTMLGIAGTLVAFVGWIWAGDVRRMGVWRIIRYVRWDEDWNGRRELKAALLKRQLMRAELDYLKTPGKLL